jgi:serine/threonine protein phosphatase 1
MLKNLFGNPQKLARAPVGERIYAIGDIHGCAALLDALLAKIDAEDAGPLEKRLVFLGDYIDRGPDSRGVVARLVEIAARDPSAVFIKGNHEAVFLDFLNDPEQNAGWLDWGGIEMAMSYGVPAPERLDSEELADVIRRNMPPAHLALLQALPLSVELGDYYFVHAGVKPGVLLEQQSEDDQLWIRGEFHDAPPEQRPNKVIVHGHHPIKKALDAGWRVAVDTGAVFTGRLTAVVLEGENRRFIST